MSRTLTFLLLAALSIGCKVDPLGGGQSVDRSLIVRTGTSFGLCLGYCWRELVIRPDDMTFTERGTDVVAYPTRTLKQATRSTDWNRIRTEVDFGAFRGLNGVYGCPDCADGGAEWIEITFDGETKRVVFEYGKTVPQIAVLTREVRALRKVFESR